MSCRVRETAFNSAECYCLRDRTPRSKKCVSRSLARRRPVAAVAPAFWALSTAGPCALPHAIFQDRDFH